MPGIQTVGQSALQNLNREHLESGPLGRVGNLRFKAEAGATPRAGGPNLFQRLGQFLSKTVFRATASPEQRAQQRVLDQARDNSRRVGDLLGKLTAAPDDARAQQKVAQELARLAERAGGDLARLPGGAQALAAYLPELAVIDVTALKSGALGSPEARQAILASIEPPELRAQAESVLTQISTAVSERVAELVFAEPLAAIGPLCANNTIDGAALNAQLTKLADHVAMFGRDLLEDAPQNLSDKMLGALYRAAQGGKAENVRQALAQIKDLDAGQLQRSQAMLELLNAVVEKNAQARMERLLSPPIAQLRTAIASGDRAAIGRELFALNLNTGPLQINFGLPLPENANAMLREAVSEAMAALRDEATNPDSPLTRDSLQRLDDETLGLLCRSGTQLGSYGLAWSRDDAQAESLSRLRDLDRNAVGSAVDILRTLAENEVPPHVLVRQLRELAGLEFQRTLQLGRMGQHGENASVDNRRLSIFPIMDAAIAQLRAQGQDAVVERAGSRMDLVQGLGNQYGLAIFGLGHLSRTECHQSVQEVLKSIKTMEAVLSGLSERLPLPEGKTPEDIEPLPLPPEYEQALAEQFGVRYDPDTMSSTINLNDAQNAYMGRFFDMAPPPGKAPQTVTLPVNGVDTQFSVSEAFYIDAIQRPSISLSVRGASLDGSTPVRSTWPREMPDEQYDASMGEALNALTQVAGQSTEALTRLMTQELGANMVLALKAMGNDSPFKLEDGSVIQINGAGHFDFDIEKNADGSFRMVATMHIPMRHGIQTDAAGNDEPVAMKPGSWAEVRVALHVAPDGASARMAELPRFGYHFEPMPE